MKTVTVHELRYHFPKVEGMLRPGEEIGVTKRGRLIARLTLSLTQISQPNRLFQIFSGK